MSFTVRDGKFDVAVVAGPRVDPWPSAGVRALSALCAEAGLAVGMIGGDLAARGVLPLPGTGGLVLAEDPQKRIHRFHARAVVRFTADAVLPDPFPGWRSQGLLPIATAQRLFEERAILWEPATVVLGTGNGALRFASTLLESGVGEVYAVEPFAQWGAKRFAGWEVERRRFEMAGGKLIEGKPKSFVEKSPLLWELRIEDDRGVRVVDVGRVVSAGPFRDSPGVREHPLGSLLFDLTQTAPAKREQDVEGWTVEEERGRWLAGRIVRALLVDPASSRDEIEAIQRRARKRLKKFSKHRTEPFTPTYQGKWLAPADARWVRSFSGAPREAQRLRPTAVIECFEDISCNLCEKACPESAIDLSGDRTHVLKESSCTGCGACLVACPSGTPLLIRELENQPSANVTLPWRGDQDWAAGEFASLVNRRGEGLGSARVTGIMKTPAVEDAPGGVSLVQIDVPAHLAWDARGIRKAKARIAASGAASSRSEPGRTEILLDGEKRLVRDGVSLSVALFETGQARPEDTLLCPDGSCGLCEVKVDGIAKAACRTRVHRGMSVNLSSSGSAQKDTTGLLCPCVGVSTEQVVERLSQGKLRSCEAVLSVTHAGSGRCHGQLCMGSFRRLLEASGVEDASQWIDWRFPWSDWALSPLSRE